MHEKIIEKVILSQDFKLEEIYLKIDTLWAEGNLTDEQRNSLKELAQKNLNPSTETPEVLKLCQELKKGLVTLNERVTKLENGGVMPEPPTDVVIETWQPWDGISDKYKYGNVVTIEQKYYISCHQGQNTWMPGSMGTEGLWKEISKENAEAVVQGTKTPEQVINEQ